MKTLALSSLLLLSSFTVFGQSASELFDKAPPAIDDALRTRVNKFYELFIAGKFKEAYVLVADDSQDRYFELAKDQYKGCEIIKIRYSDEFTKAAVVTSCKADWRWHGAVTLTTFPLTSTWKVIDGQWFWHYEKPTMVPNPFSPTGFVTVPADSNTSNAGLIPKDLNSAALGILSKVGIDRSSVRLRSSSHSQEIVRVRNDMPGQVSLKLSQPELPGLKVSVGKTELQAHEQTVILFEWQPDGSAKKISAGSTVQLRIEPTGQTFPISVVFDNAPVPPPPAATPPK